MKYPWYDKSFLNNNKKISLFDIKEEFVSRFVIGKESGLKVI